MFSRLKRQNDPAPPVAGSKWYLDETSAAEAIANDSSGEQRAEADAQIEDYLDHVSAELLVLPRTRRAELRREIGQHVTALAQAHEELGAGPVEAAETALKRFGDPAKIGREFARTWKRPVTWDQATAFPGEAMKQGLLWFGGAGLLTLVSSAVLTTPLGTSNAGLWQCWNAAALVGVPLLAGWRVGVMAPVRAAFGTFLALSLLLLVAAPFCTYFSTLPYCVEPLEPAVLLLAWWMPLGCAAAAVSARHGKRRSSRFRFASR